MASVDIGVEGITCGGCEKSIRNALLAQEGVREASASRESGIVKVDFDENRVARAALEQAIRDAGFDVVA
jgi:copper chaperone